MAALRKKEKIKLSQKEKTKKINRFIIFSILTISISLLFPGGEQLDYNYEIGDITREEIVAEFNFPILKSEDQLQKELIEAKVKVPYEFQRNQNISIDQNKKIEIFLMILKIYLMHLIIIKKRYNFFGKKNTEMKKIKLKLMQLQIVHYL